ncbi:ATP-binding cassette sub-family A member 17-like [Amblyomma americanum]
MDPKCRHEVWEVLARMSRRSSVLVTTQSIEEAEVLADRLIVMRDGRLVCAGSPTWLKTKFDSGFFLRFTKLANFRERDVKKVVQYHMGAVEPKRVTKLEMVFNLSDSLQYAPRMARMLHYLEKRRIVLGIAFMSLTSCTMEDVYISMVSGQEPKPKVGAGDTRAASPAQQEVDAAKEKQELEAVKQLCTARSANAGVFTVLLALLHKRLLFWIRVWWTKPLSVGIIVASMVLLVLCEMHLLPSALPAASSFTYTPKELFDVSYGFIEADNASKKFANTVLLPVMSERSVKVFSPTSTFVERELLFWAQQNIHNYIFEYQYGVSVFGDQRAYAWFNGQCPYSAMLSLNMLHTALLRNLTGQKGSLITLVNSPFVDKNRIHKMEFERNYGKLMLEPGHNRLGHEMELFTTRNLITRLLYSFFVSLALSSYAASHVFAPMVEWSSGLKHMQLMTGMSGCLYWMGHFLFDMIMALCNSFLLTFIIFLSHMQITVGYHLAILALFVANAFSSMPLTYLFSGLFRDPTWAFSFLALGLFLAGMVGSIGVEILQVLVQEDPSTTSSPGLVLWGFVFRWFPTYSLVRGVIKVILLFRWNAICLTGGELLEEACQEPHFALDERISRCCEAKAENKTARLLYPLQPFHETGFYEAVSMVIQGTLYLAILSLADAQAFYNLRWYLARRFHGGEESDEAPEQQRGPRLVAVSMDPEVEREGNLVNQVCRTKAFKDVAMVIRNMQKAVGFITPAKVLDGVSILLNRGECLGLVGINNSGKSTLLEVLVGLQVPTGGGAHTAALSLGVDLRAWQQCIGYAPDGISEANMPALTVGELLDLMARLRGVLWRRQAVLGALSLVGRLKEDQMINKCSHGEMKMLLIVAAVMGVPPVVLLDEPYSDVEPLYRNEIIRMVQVLKGAQAMSIIMTSHRMSHCEVLCDRVAVMEAGKIEALGDALQMNQKYGRSYIVTLRLPPERRFDYQFQRILVDMMQEEFHQCSFGYNYKGMMSFRVGKTYTSWSELFTKMVAFKSNQELPEFSVCDITLEHIFVGLARRQILITGVRPHNYLSGGLSRLPSRVETPRRTY